MSMRITIDDPDYPHSLHGLPEPPAILTTSGPLQRGRAIAIVGSRRARDESLVFAYDLAFKLANAGFIVVSGGAVGVDGAAHRGALAAGGTTWVVSPTGKDRVYPPQHQELFAQIAASESSRMIWCFPDDQRFTSGTPRYRNGVLAALTEALVVVQATFQSGSRNATGWARDLKRPVWAMTAAPWMSDFNGTLMEIERGLARPLCSPGHLLQALGLEDRPVEVDGALRPKKHGRAPFSRRAAKGPPKAVDMGGWSLDEKLIFSTLLTKAQHVDQIAGRTALPTGSTVTALLTLSLKDVVVEGPEGFFRRRSVT